VKESHDFENIDFGCQGGESWIRKVCCGGRNYVIVHDLLAGDRFHRLLAIFRVQIAGNSSLSMVS
jgi:hypothetical protein